MTTASELQVLLKLHGLREQLFHRTAFPQLAADKEVEEKRGLEEKSLK